MTRQPVRSFLIRLEADGDARAGTVTSVQTGEQVTFASFSELSAVLERMTGSVGAAE